MKRRFARHWGRGAFVFFWGPALTVQLLHEAPKQIVAGDSIDFLVAIPSDLEGWTGSARLTGPSQMNGAVVTEGSDFHVTFKGQSASGTKTLAAGQYELTVWATNGEDRYTVAKHALSVLADLAVGEPAQSHAQRMLSIIEAAIQARVSGNADGGIENYAIDGLSVSKIPIEQLEKLRAKYANEVIQAQQADAPFGSVKFYFTKAGTPADMVRRY